MAFGIAGTDGLDGLFDSLEGGGFGSSGFFSEPAFVPFAPFDISGIGVTATGSPYFGGTGFNPLSGGFGGNAPVTLGIGSTATVGRFAQTDSLLSGNIFVLPPGKNFHPNFFTTSMVGQVPGPLNNSSVLGQLLEAIRRVLTSTSVHKEGVWQVLGPFGLPNADEQIAAIEEAAGVKNITLDEEGNLVAVEPDYVDTQAPVGKDPTNGRGQLGENLQEGIVDGSRADIKGPIDAKRWWPQNISIEDIIGVDPFDPEVRQEAIKGLILGVLGEALKRLGAQIQTEMIEEAQKKALARRQLEIEQFLARIRQVPTHLVTREDLQNAIRTVGTGLQLPVESVTPVRLVGIERGVLGESCQHGGKRGRDSDPATQCSSAVRRPGRCGPRCRCSSCRT